MNRGQESGHTLKLQDQATEFLRYTAPNGEVQVEVLLSNGLQEEVVCSILEHTTAHGAIAGKIQPHQAKLLKVKDAGNE